MPLLSVCVPTFERQHLIREAIESCFRQNFRPIEILIGDDSSSEATEAVVASLAAPDGIQIRYKRNNRTLGQSANVNALIEAATGTYLTLLHDDDAFCDGGIDILMRELERHPSAACIYGMQHVTDEFGEVLPDATANWNERDRRVAGFAGTQSSPLRAALMLQVPNDCFLLRSAIAKRFPLRDEAVVGHAVDADFIIGIARHSRSGDFVFVPQHVSRYRLTRESIARSDHINVRQDLFFASLRQDAELRRESEAVDELLRRIAIGATLDAARAGRWLDALRIMASRHYSAPYWSKLTAYRLVAVAAPTLAWRIKQILDRRTEQASSLRKRDGC